MKLFSIPPSLDNHPYTMIYTQTNLSGNFSKILNMRQIYIIVYAHLHIYIVYTRYTQSICE